MNVVDISEEMESALISRAREMSSHAYAPYSRFRVGAAVLADSGRMYSGANVENASYPVGICAERNAIAQAVCSGERRLLAIALCGGKEGEQPGRCLPCGMCRQTMREFCDPEEFRVIVARSTSDYKVYSLDQLLPESFGPEALCCGPAGS